MTLPSRLSPSALDRFRRCPKQFFLQDVERTPRLNEASPVLAQANAIHDALAQFFGLPRESRAPENLERALRAVWRRNCKPGSFRSVAEEVSYGVGAIEMLRRFAGSADLEARPLAREQWLSLRVGGIELFGKLDRLDRARGGGLNLIDYKTGQRQLEPEDLRDEPAVQVYLLAAEAQTSLPVERVRFVYLAHGSEVVWEPEREDVESLRERLTKVVARIQTTEAFTASPGPHCRFCPFRLVCGDNGRVSLADLDPDPELAF